MWLDFDVRETTGDGLFHRRKRYYGLWTIFNSLKRLNDEFVSYKHADFGLRDVN